METRSKSKTTKLTNNTKLINKKTNTRSNGYKSESFDRFGDDLCELVLNYLKISDKIVLQFVSKQWQRLIFTKLKSIAIKYNRFGEPEVMDKTGCFALKDKLQVKILLKKFESINEITIKINCISEILEIITNYKFLRKVSICLRQELYYKKSLIRFGLKCGQSLSFIDIKGINDLEMKSILRSTPNLKKVSIYSNIKPLIEIFLENLEEINFKTSQVLNINDLKCFTDKYQKQIKKLVIVLDSFAKYKTKNTLIQISRFEKLFSLQLKKFYFSCDNELKLIANNCQELRHLSISGLQFDLKVINCFKCFTTIELDFKYLSDESMGCFESDLTVVSLKGFNSGINDKTLEKLSEIKSLSKVVLISHKITDSGISSLVKNSENLRTIYVNNRRINDMTIDVIKQKAINNPRVQYYFIASDVINKKLKTIIDEKIPKNLLIRKIK